MTHILIVLTHRQLYFYQNNKLDNSFPVAIGKKNTPTPTGEFSILNKITNPYNDALGTRWMQFTYKMHGIHGTNQPQFIGQAVSQGCIRMYNSDVEYIFSQVSIGTPVLIRKFKSPSAVEYFIYTVQSDDTLYQLAQQFNTTIAAILEINNLNNQHLIYPGQKLKIPLC